MPDNPTGMPYTIDNRMTRVELRTQDNTHELEALRTSLDTYVLKLSSRPSWGVVYALAFMQALVGVLLSGVVYLAATR